MRRFGLIALFLLVAPFTAKADCTSAAATFLDSYLSYIAAAPLEIQRLPFAIREKAYNELRQKQLPDIYAAGITDGDPEVCFRNALFSSPRTNDAVNNLVGHAGGALPMVTVTCPPGPSYAPVAVDANRLTTIGLQPQFVTPRGWLFEFNPPNATARLQQAVLDSYLTTSAPQLVCLYEGGFVFKRGAVSCRPNTMAGFVTSSYLVPATCTTGKCAVECGADF